MWLFEQKHVLAEAVVKKRARDGRDAEGVEGGGKE